MEGGERKVKSFLLHRLAQILQARKRFFDSEPRVILVDCIKRIKSALSLKLLNADDFHSEQRDSPQNALMTLVLNR